MPEGRAVLDRALRIELPFPPKQLSPNARVHWREKAKVVARYREDCGWAGVAAWRNGKPYRDKPPINLQYPVRAAVTFVVPDRRRRDLDNLLAMLKPAWDGLCDAGVLAGDDSARFSVGEVKVEVLHQDAHVVVELRVLGGLCCLHRAVGAPDRG